MSRSDGTLMQVLTSLKHAVVWAIAVAAASSAPASAHAAALTPTFSRDVAPIFYKHCTNCHRPGEIAPMSLLTYRDVRPWVRAIGVEVGRGAMPPWHADPRYGVFLNDRSLSASDRELILNWVAGGAAEGNPQDLPVPPDYGSGWTIGQPDAVFSLREDVSVPASGILDYRFLEVPTDFVQDKWIQAVQVRPGTPSVVHHVIVFARPPRPSAPGSARVSDRHLATFAPGHGARVFQPGTAVRLPAGWTLVFQIHYVTNGTAATDRSSVAFVFSKEPPTHEVVLASLVNPNFTIPAGAANFKVDAGITIDRDMTLWSMLPHAHARCNRWEVQVMYPDGRIETILLVPKYDTNWQTDYILTRPLTLPKGTKLRTSASYDNSAGNKANPDPTADVRWGEQTWQEMQSTVLALSFN